jgi:hypothetical protein
MIVQSSGWVGQWSPGIGDPTVAGWVTVVAYACAVFLCARAYRRCKLFSEFVAERRTWGLLATALLALGINKQLDLQTALTEVARGLARQQGWYAGRRPLQAAFVIAVALVGAVTALWMWRQARKGSLALRHALFGAVVLTAFVVIRAASFHHVDLLLGEELAGLRLNVFLELGGISWVTYGAAKFRVAGRLT